jgi:hypothetical protein
VTVSATDEQQEARGGVVTSYKNAPTRTITAGGTTYAYRELGPKGGIPVVFFVHLAATLDNWDPRIIDPIAKNRHVIAFDNIDRARLVPDWAALGLSPARDDSGRDARPGKRKNPPEHASRSGKQAKQPQANKHAADGPSSAE